MTPPNPVGSPWGSCGSLQPGDSKLGLEVASLTGPAVLLLLSGVPQLSWGPFRCQEPRPASLEHHGLWAASKEGKSSSQAPPCLMTADIRLAKASHMAKPIPGCGVLLLQLSVGGVAKKWGRCNSPQSSTQILYFHDKL